MKPFQYHFEPKTGWMNDPNGLVEYQDQYHAFFQHFPYDIHWGPMHWGHAVSTDLVHWTQIENALVPNETYENEGGCFSGSAIEKDGRLYLIYTSVSRELGQTQSVAYSDDGIHFTKYSGNPVITHYPEEDATRDFRDPKVFAYEDEYRLVLGTCFNGRGRVLCYRSEDLLHWEYMGVLYEALGYSSPIECPDFFPLGDKWVLMFSKMGNPGYQTQFIIGSYDGKTFTPESYQSPEGGPQFYAPQTFEAQDGRRIMIAWMYDWHKKPVQGYRSAGALTISRELWIDEQGKLHSYPVEEAWDYIRNVTPELKDTISGNLTDIPGITITASTKKVTVTNVTSPLTLQYSGTIESLELLEDERSVEVFINSGSASFTVHA